MSQSTYPWRKNLGEGFSLNYLHYGSALEGLPLIIHRFRPEKSVYKKDVITYLESLKGLKDRQLRELTDVVAVFGGISEQTLDISDIGRAIEESQKWKTVFRSLKCKGFSFRLCENPKFHCRLKRHVNVRTALLAGPTLYYPPKVREGFKKAFSVFPMTTHVPKGIGWMLGTKRRIEGKNWWFIINIQSDLMSKQISSLKEIFRGWQRVLFQLLAVLAHRHNISVIAVPPAKAVMEACLSSSLTQSVPENWQYLYEGTAEFFSMKTTSLRKPIDLQTLWYRRAAWCSEFYLGDVSELLLQR